MRLKKPDAGFWRLAALRLAAVGLNAVGMVGVTLMWGAGRVPAEEGKVAVFIFALASVYQFLSLAVLTVPPEYISIYFFRTGAAISCGGFLVIIYRWVQAAGA